MKVLQIHTKYLNFGGEDTTVLQERELLSISNEIETLFFQNKEGLVGFFQFLFSIWNIFAANKLSKKIKEFKPEIVHIHNWHYAAGPIIIRVCRQHNIRVIMTIHNFRLLCPSALLFHNNKLFEDSVTKPFPWLAIRKKVYRKSYLQTFWLALIVWFHKKIGTWNLVDRYLFLTPFALELHQNSSLGVDKSKFIIKPNFTYHFPYNELVKREGHYLYVGRLSEEKGIKLLISAFKDSTKLLKIIGSGPLEGYVKETCLKNENIQYLGGLDRQEVMKQLSKCSILIFPSIWYEGMPLTIIEAFACSTPVIASNLGAMSSMIIHEENGLHFLPNNLHDLKNKIQKWYNLNNEEKEFYYNNAFTHYKNLYSDYKQVLYFNNIFKEVIRHD